MAVTIIYEDKPVSVAGAQARGDDLWMSKPELQSAAGWELKPQGICRGERCVPIPPGRREQFLRDELVNFAALARQLGLPDLDGRMHSLSDYRGRKVLLLSWASW